jgi:hypothetical protein
VTLDELEAAIWHELPRLSSGYAPDRCAAMNAVLDHIEDYATAQNAIFGEQAIRRAVLEAATRAPRTQPAPQLPRVAAGWTELSVHWQKPGAGQAVAACHGRPTTAQVTAERGRVTCGSCTGSAAWRKSLLGVAS